MLNVIDLNKGEIVWKVILGFYVELEVEGMELIGIENYGGFVVIVGGLIFIVVIMDKKIRVFL